MNEMFKPKNYRQIKKEWDNLKINLELLEIKGEIKKDLYLFIENNEKMKNYYKNINFKKKQKILLEIYEYINYEISKIERKEDNNKIRLKTLGDKERKEKDYGRIIYQDLEKKEGKDIDDKNNEKAPKSFLKQIKNTRSRCCGTPMFMEFKRKCWQYFSKQQQCTSIIGH